MKALFSSIMFLHGAIHLLGFVKAFQIAQVTTLSANIGRPQGVVWLIVFALFSLAAFLFISSKSYWPWVAIAGVIISTLLITGVWAEAKYGMIPNLIIAVAAIGGFSSCSMNRMIASETQLLLEAGKTEDPQIITLAHIQSLPIPVQKWIENSGMIGKPEIFNAQCKQFALMKMKPGQKEWHTAEALQYTTTLGPGFIWTVRMKMNPIITIRGRDKYMNGKGEMRIRMNSLFNIVNETGSKLDEGTLQRFLGELVWMPSLALSPYITWEELDAHSAKATMSYNGVEGSGIFYFNEDGDFVKFIAQRYMGNKPDSQKYPWILTVEEYAEFEGIRLPSKMEATWRLDEGDWTWLKLKVADVRFNINTNFAGH